MSEQPEGYAWREVSASRVCLRCASLVVDYITHDAFHRVVDQLLLALADHAAPREDQPKVESLTECPECGGDGYSDPYAACPTCGHEARVAVTCPACNGSGRAQAKDSSPQLHRAPETGETA